MPNQRIVIADDHPVFREGLAALLAGMDAGADIDQVGTYEQLLAHSRNGARPSLFLLDLHFPGMDIHHGISELRSEFPLASIVIVSMSDDASSIEKVMKAGVDGFISKAATQDQMRDALAAVQDGEFVNVSAGSGLAQARSSTPFEQLTERQRDVLKCLAKGHSNKQIARELGISPFTVRIHVSAVLHELKLENRSSAAVFAAKHGL